MAGLGEREIIKIFLEVFGKPPRKALPLGDDVSGFMLDDGKVAVLKVDMFVDKTDMPPGMSFFQAGWKAMVMSVSDFAAKSVKPQTALVGLGLPKNLGRDKVREIGLGLRRASERYGFKIVGGDTNEALNLTISTVVFGVSKREDIVLRRGAKVGDLVAVSGRFGKTSSGLKILLEGLKAPPNLKKKLLNPVYMPKARLSLGLNLKKVGATSAIDSSDGLAWSLYELSKASGVGFILDRIPIAEEAKVFARLNRLDPFNLAFYGGEEYELVVTLNPEKFARAPKSLRKRFLVIGRVVKEKKIVYVEKNVERKVEAKGWEHFT